MDDGERKPRAVIPPRDEVDREIGFHIEMRTRELVERGMDPVAARRMAIARFGGLEAMRQELQGLAQDRDTRARHTEFFSELRHDVSIALRALRRQPTFTILATLILALGVGVTAAIFSLANDTLFTPPPLVRNAHELVRINRAGTAGGRTSNGYPDFAAFDSANTVFTTMAAYAPDAVVASLRTRGGDEPAVVDFSTADFFSTLGVPFEHGRAFGADEDREGAATVAVVTRALAEREFGDAARAVGSPISMNGRPFTIVGVLPQKFRGASLEDASADIWLPLWARPGITGRTRQDFVRTPGSFHGFLTVIGRLKPGVSMTLVDADVATMTSRLAAAAADTALTFGASRPFSLDPATREALVRMLRLFAAVGAMVLLIACANLGNLMLARGAARSREVAVRAALGAGRVRLVRHILTESVVLAIMGGLLGAVATIWTTRLVGTVLPSSFAQAGRLDIPLFVVALGIAVATALLASLASAARLLRSDASSVLRAGIADSAGTNRIRSALVVAQVSLSFALLAGAGLFVRTLQGVRSVPLGYELANELVVYVDLRAAGYADSAGAMFFSRLVERAKGIPGVQSAALAAIAPLHGGRRTGSVQVEGVDPPPGEPSFTVDVNAVTPGYFQTLGTSLLRGRDFEATDDAHSPGTAIVNESMARRFWPDQDPVGRRIRRGDDAPWLTVVGVVRNARYVSATLEPGPMLFRPVGQSYGSRMRLHLRTAGDPIAILRPLRQAVSELDPSVIVRDPVTLQSAYDRATERFVRNARLVTVLGALALLLAAAGLYAVMSYLATRRRREIGVRMALGARPGTVMRALAREGMTLTLLGVAFGVLLALATGRLLTGFLFGVQPFDVVALVAALVVLSGAALAASIVPARRAARVDPMIALRSD